MTTKLAKDLKHKDQFVTKEGWIWEVVGVSSAGKQVIVQFGDLSQKRFMWSTKVTVK